MIEIKNGGKQITTKYLSLDILKNINLKIVKGEMVAITGPSGSGKTTVLNILGALDALTSGEFFYDGQNIAIYKEKKRALLRNSSFGFIVQNFALLHDYTVFENVEMPLRFARKKKKAREKNVEAILRELEIIGHKNKMPYELSGGQQQRVAIARALINNPDVILADEPTGALDIATGQKVIALLLEANKNGKTVIIVTHDENIARRCKRRIYLEDGKIIKDEFQEENKV
ncbi:ABC transporter ATP-binding protein [Erysipelotrichaceae bacterium]|nr:ABC transporter ATP-binding protein [Erysipelotrichaceae bacterium]